MIRCKICKKLFRRITASHLWYKHGTTVKKYRKKFGVKYVCCKSSRKLRGIINEGNDYALGSKKSKNWIRNKRKEMLENKHALGRIVSEEEKEKARIRALRNKYGLGHKRSEENKEKDRIRMNRMLADGTIIPGSGRCKMYPVKNHIGNIVMVQGKLEVRFAETLTRLGIRWKRPKKKTYILDGKEHYYFCDFYLKDYKRYVEVKSRYYYNKYKEGVLVKKRMMVEKGKRKGFRYKIMFEKNIKGFELNVADVVGTLLKEVGL